MSRKPDIFKYPFLRELSCFLLFAIFCFLPGANPFEGIQGSSHSPEWRNCATQNAVTIHVQESSVLLKTEGDNPAPVLWIPTVLQICLLEDSYFLSKPYLNLEILSSRNHPPTI